MGKRDIPPRIRMSRPIDEWFRNIRLMLSSKQWDLSVIKHLVENNPKLLNVPKFHRKTLLQVMALDKRGTADMVEFLIEHGADVNLATYGGRLLMDAIKCCKTRPGIVKVLVKNGANVLDFKHGPSVLSDAVCEMYRTDVLRCIIARGVDVNHVDEFGRSVLCRALSYGRGMDVVHFLHDSGAKWYACTRHKSPLHCVVSGRRVSKSVVGILLTHCVNGGNVIVNRDLERTVMHDALRSSNYEPEAMCMIVRREIVANDANRRDANDSTYLHEAICNEKCHIKVVRCLVELGAEVSLVDRSGDTALHKALSIQLCNDGIVRFLLELGSPVNIANRFGETSLVVAVKKQQSLRVLRQLMSSGEMVAVKNWNCLSVAYDQYQSKPEDNENLSRFRILMKYLMLEHPGHIELEKNITNFPDWTFFYLTCLMEAQKIAFTRTLQGKSLMTVLGYGLPFTQRNCHESLTPYQNEFVMLAIANVDFENYEEVLIAKLGRCYVNDMFEEIVFNAPYSYKNKHNESILRNTKLNRECLECLSNFLSHEDKVNMILLFHERYINCKRNKKFNNHCQLVIK